MIDPKEIQAVFSAAHEFSRKTNETLSAPFLAGAADMSIASAANVSAIVSGAQAIGTKMLSQMTSLKESIDQQVFMHQDAQARQQTHDFTTNMNDLRETVARGFPNEMTDQFFSQFDLKK